MAGTFLGDWRILGVPTDSTSVPSVVRLSLAVELEGARPESLLRSLGSFVRDTLGDSCRVARFRRKLAIPLEPLELWGGVATVMGIGGFPGTASSYEIALSS